jgi:hypothetical protein
MAIFWPSSLLSRVDLPALGGPTMATTPDRNSVVLFSVLLIALREYPNRLDYCHQVQVKE